MSGHSLIGEVINFYKSETPKQKVPYVNLQVLCYGGHIHQIEGEVKQVKKKDRGNIVLILAASGKAKRLYSVYDPHSVLKVIQGGSCRVICMPTVLDDGLIQYQALKEQNPQKCIDLNDDPFQVKVTDFECRDWEFGIQNIPLSRVRLFKFDNGRIGFNYTAA